MNYVNLFLMFDNEVVDNKVAENTPDDNANSGDDVDRGLRVR